MKNYVDWYLVFKCQKISEELIEECCLNMKNWNSLIENQSISIPFIEKHQDKFDLNLLKEKGIIRVFFNCQSEI